MFGQSSKRPGWRRMALAVGGIALATGGLCWVRLGGWPRAAAQPAAPPSAAPAPAAPLPTDYARRVVAYLGADEAVTRQELGEYLIARQGTAKLDLLIKKRIIEDAGHAANIEVTGSEIESALEEGLREMGVNRETFVNSVLKKYRQSLYEWKEDVLRPKLMLTKLCRSRVHVTNQEIEQAYVQKFGEKFDGRLILWPVDQKDKAEKEYASLHGSETAFQELARRQSSPSLRAAGGKIKPFGHGVMEPPVEAAAFRLQPGQVSDLIFVDKLGYAVLKCDRRLPATNPKIDTVRSELIQEVVAKNVDVEMKRTFKDLYDQANPSKVKGAVPDLKDEADQAPRTMPAPGEAVAFYKGNVPITREELGEFLIERYGAEKLDCLVNKRIIDQACRQRGLTVSAPEIEQAFARDLKTFNLTAEQFRQRLLDDYRKSIYEWKEDVLRPKLLLMKLCRDRVRCTEEDVRMAFEAHYGEKVRCKVIIWPQDQLKYALQVYPKIRDSDTEFENMARSQMSVSLATKAGEIEPFGRHTTGDDRLEEEAFRLQPGDVSTLMTTAQGHLVLKCLGRVPARTDVRLEAERARLTEEVLEKKAQGEMQVVVKELRAAAKPRLMLQDTTRPVDITEETRRELTETPEGLTGPAASLFKHPPAPPQAQGP